MNPDYNQVPPNQQWQGNQLPPPQPQSPPSPVPPPPLPTPETPPYNPWQQNEVVAPPASQPEAYAGYRPTAPLPGPAANMPASSAPDWQRPAPPPPPPIEPEPISYGTNEYEVLRPRRWPAITFAIIMILLLAGVGYTGYKTFFAASGKKSSSSQPAPAPTPPPTTPPPEQSPVPQPTPPPPPPAAPVVADLGTIAGAVLTAPTDMTGFRANDLGVATVKDYTDPSGKCDLQFGSLPASSLPGGNLDELLAPQLNALRASGATVTGPTIAPALELKDANDPNATYTMSTAVVSFVLDAKQGTSHYSVSILKNGDRAFVSRSCVNAHGPIDQAALDALDAKAKQITITKQ